MKNWITFLLFSFCTITTISSQSFEAMAGTERIFIDAQFLKFFDKDFKWSLFSRARATAEYDQNATNLFSGAYLNYTTKSGFGGSLVGRIGTTGSGMDIGPHYFKATKDFSVFILPTINLNDELAYSWFSIMRYTPAIKNDWKVYSSLELFSSFVDEGHVFSVQRIRLGIDKKGYQFGFAVNLTQLRTLIDTNDTNLGAFIRKAF